MIRKEIVQDRIKSLRADLNSGTWPTLEGYIKGQIAAYEQEIKDIENG